VTSKLTPTQQRIKEVFEILRPYQRDVFIRMVQDKKHLCYMDMGMGKTLVTSLATMYTGAFPCVIVCTKSAMYVWEEELRKWFNEPALIYAGKPKQRAAVWKEFTSKGYKFIITNYSLAKELAERFGKYTATDAKGTKSRGTANAKQPTPPPGTYKWNIGSIIADEIQLGGLFNHETKTYGVFKKLVKDVSVRYFLTGTPYRRGVIDFYGPLSLVDEKNFNSFWKFVHQHCVIINTGFGKSIERNPKDVIAFRAMLRRYASILKKEDYLDDLPGKVRQAIPIDMDNEQRHIYEELTEQLFAETYAGELIMAPGALSLMVRQRQLLVCPQELGLRTRGAAIDTLVEMVGDFVEDRKPFVVFTPFKKAVPWISKALKEEYPGIRIFEITGGLTPEEFRDAWQGFQSSESRGPKALICVIKSGASFHATVADTCFFLGYEWDFNQNAQAEDRLNRMGQKKLVTCYYFMHRGTVDDEITQRLNDKKYSADLVLSDEQVFEMMLKKKGGKSK